MSAAPRHDYDAIWAETYGGMQDAGPVHRHMRRLLRRILAPLDYHTALDVGCGLGHNVPLIKADHPDCEVTGVDVSALALERARARVPGRFVQLDVEEDHLEGAWDLVLCSLLLEHLVDDVGALRNMRAMTGRYFLATTIAGDFERYRRWDERMGHVRNYAVGELEEKLARTGFRVTRAIYWGFPFYSPLARELQNLSGTGTGQYGLLPRALAELFYWLDWLNSGRRGDLLLVLATVDG